MGPVFFKKKSPSLPSHVTTTTHPCDLLTKLGFKTPIIVAPMAGGPTTVELAAGASEAGAMGSLGGAYSNAETLRAMILEMKKSTSHAFAVNLFVPSNIGKVSDSEMKQALDATRVFRKELELKDPAISPPYEENFDEQFAVILETKPAALSFIFGSIGRERVEQCRKAGILTFGTATSLEEAKILEADGVDAIIAQGAEAGGHRGFFEATHVRDGLKLRELLTLLKQNVNIPLIAAGGIMNGSEIAEILKLGAQAVQMGTAFLACKESGTNETYLKTLLNPKPKPTELTRAFSGRWARGLQNRFMTAMKDSKGILPFPAQNAFTRDIRLASFKKAIPDYMSMWAGTGVDTIRALPVRELIAQLEAERLAKPAD